jgi:hypothetical protein
MTQVSVEILEAPPVSVEIVEDNGVMVVEIDRPTAVEVVEIIHPGPQGPAGQAAGSYVHSQTTPSSAWTMAHNLGFKPSVELLNAGSQEIEGDVVHLSQNVCIAYFTIPIAGFARLN